MINAIESALDLKLVKRGLYLLTGLAVLVCAGDMVFLLFFPRPDQHASVRAKISLESAPAQPLSFYESSFQGSGLFGGPAPSNGLTVLKSSINELAKDYRLKGIVILSEPEAIVQDARSQQNTFVKAGQKLGELSVKEIGKDKITLTYFGEEAVLEIE